MTKHSAPHHHRTTAGKKSSFSQQLRRKQQMAKEFTSRDDAARDAPSRRTKSSASSRVNSTSSDRSSSTKSSSSPPSEKNKQPNSHKKQSDSSDTAQPTNTSPTTQEDPFLLAMQQMGLPTGFSSSKGTKHQDAEVSRISASYKKPGSSSKRNKTLKYNQYMNLNKKRENIAKYSRANAEKREKAKKGQK